MAPPTTSTTTTQDSLFSLPTELLTTLAESFPCRGPQIRTLATLVYPSAAPVRNLIIHGVEATGKSAITARTLGAMHDHDPSVLDYAVVRSAECVTARHLYERTVGAVADAVAEHLDARPVARCETLAALAVELGRLLERYDGQGTRDEDGDGDDDGNRKRKSRRRFVLVFDGIDRQREAPPTLLPALARLSEMIPNLTTIFITTSPPTSSLRLPSAPATLAFPAYTKTEYIAILSHIGPPDPKKPLPNSTAAETAELWARFAAATHDALIRPAGAGAGAGGGLTALLRACRALWPRFTAPVAAGTHRAREFGRLLVAARVLFQDERVLVPGVLAAKPSSSSALPLPSTSTPTPSAPGTPLKQGAPAPTTTTTNNKTAGSDLAALLPRTARLLLIAAYLASHNAPRHDDAIFSTWDARKKKRRRHRGPNKKSSLRQHRRIARRLLGPGAFVLERMVAIYAATRREWVTADPHYPDDDHDNNGGGGVDADVAMALATLSSLRLLVRVGGGAGAGGGGGGWGGGADLDRGAKWRVNVGWEVIRALGRSMGVEVEEWLVE